MDLQTRLALYRTRLAEKRTAIAQLQFGLLLVTLPITLHAGLMLLTERHAVVGRLDILAPLSLLLGLLLITGLAMTYIGARDLRRASRAVVELREGLDSP